MPLSPADFYAYSRATGTPYPEEPEERAQIAPQVLEFRRNQLKAPRQEENQGFNLTNALGIGAAVAGLGAGAYGLRRVLGPRAKVASELPNVPRGEGLDVGAEGNLVRDLVARDAEIQKAVGRSSAPPPSKTPDPWAGSYARKFVEDTGAVEPGETPSPTVAPEKTPATLLGFLQDVREKEEFRSIGRPVTPYRPGSLADRITKEQQQLVRDSLDSTNPETTTYVAKLNERRKVRAEQAQELADSVRDALISGEQQEGYDLSTSQVEMAGSSAASAFKEAQERQQQHQPAPITHTWQNKLFDDRGMLRQDVIAMHLGDENVIPKPIAQKLIASIQTNSNSIPGLLNPNNFTSFNDSSAVYEATKHVRENLLAYDYQNSIKNYLLSGDPGDLQPAQSRGFGWSARGSSPTDVITVSTGEGGEQTLSVARRASAKHDVSDLEPLYLDPKTNTLVRKADIGTSGTADPESGTGIGEEIGQAVAFVPRQQLSPFVSTPGVSGSGEATYKEQGVGYAIGGVKEFGGGSGAGYVAKDTSLPVLSPEEHVKDKNVGISSNGNIFAKVKPISLVGDPRLSKRLDQEYGNFFYRHPTTGAPWRSLEEASAFVNQVHSQFNETQLVPIQSQLETKQLYRGPMEVVLSGRDVSGRKQKTWLDPYQKLSDIGEATLSSQMQDMLLQKGVIQEAQTEEGAKYLRQTRYSVPDVIEEKETKNWTLGPEHTGMFPVSADEGKPNHYEYLDAVQNAYQNLTGNRLADIDLALTLRSKKGGQYLGGPSANPYLNKALTVANTLTQISETTRQRVMEPGAIEGLGERYGLGATVSAPASKSIPSRQRTVPLVSASFEPVYEWNPEKQIMEYIGDKVKYKTTDAQISPETIGAKRLAAALTDYRSRSGRPMKQADFMQFASSIAQQEGADINELIKQTSIISRGAGQQAIVGRVMSQGRAGLSAMDRISPAEEVAQTISEYDFGETIGKDIEEAIQGPDVPLDVDMELTARQVQRAKMEPPGTTEKFTIDDQMLSNQMSRLMAQAGRRSGKRRNR